MKTISLEKEIRIGLNVVVEGEKADIQGLLTSFSQLMSLLIPVLLWLNKFLFFFGLVAGAAQDTILELRGYGDLLKENLDYLGVSAGSVFWPVKRDLIIIRVGLALLFILAWALVTR